MNEICGKYGIIPPSEMRGIFIADSLRIDQGGQKTIRSLFYDELDKFEILQEKISYIEALNKEFEEYISKFKYKKIDLGAFRRRYSFVYQELYSLREESLRKEDGAKVKTKTVKERIERVEEIYRQTQNYKEAIEQFNREMGEVVYSGYNSFKAARYNFRKKNKGN